MDRVFGEGQYTSFPGMDFVDPMSIDEREEALENESEVTSLIPNSPRRARQSLSPHRKDILRGRPWLNRMFGGANAPALYEPIADSEE
jgi:hypothetical protein